MRAKCFLFLSGILFLSGTAGIRQITVIQEQGKPICEGNTYELCCPLGHTMTIEAAYFGRDDTNICRPPEQVNRKVPHCTVPSYSVVSALRKCNGRHMCNITASEEFMRIAFVECSAKKNMYLQVNYTCTQTLYKALVCDGEEINLRCPPNQVITTDHAFYGRSDANTCPTSQSADTQCSAQLASRVFRELCDGHNKCHLSDLSSKFGDPCPGTPKYLKLNYTCQSCQDIERTEKCQEMAAEGKCETDVEYMYSYCYKTCSKCGGKTPCINNYDNSTDHSGYCHNRTEDGACWKDPAFMIPNCAKSCFNCEDDAVRCVNSWGNDKECKQWFADGEATRNTGFMLTRCTKTMLNCKERPVCNNMYHNDSQCDRWAEIGECLRNPVWMYRNCWKSCLGCPDSSSDQCKNLHNDNYKCKMWANGGQCITNKAWMMKNCHRSCSRCLPETEECYNLKPDDYCNRWRDRGHCHSNPGFMLIYCKMSCTGCDKTKVQEKVGSDPVPGEVLELTEESTVVLPDTFKRKARLTSFSAFFAGDNEVTLQVFRPETKDKTDTDEDDDDEVSTKNGNEVLKAVVEVPVKPYGTNYAQTVKMKHCMKVLPGDRIGFTSKMKNKPAPVAMNVDENRKTKVSIRDSGSHGSFKQMSTPGKFSVSAVYEEQECP